MKKLEEILNYKQLKDISREISVRGQEELSKLIEYCGNNKIDFHKIILLVRSFIEYDVPPNWIERVELSRNHFKNDSSSLESHINRYGEIRGLEKYNEKVKKSTVSKEKFLLTSSEEEWQNLNRSKSSNNMTVLIERYGIEEAEKRRQSYLVKWKNSIHKKNGWDNGLSLNSLIQKYGEKEGLRRWNDKKDKQRKRFSIEWYIEKYGEDEGKNKWEDYRTHMSLVSLQAAEQTRKCYSKISQKLFSEIASSLNLPTSEVFFHDCNGEKIVKKYINGKYCSFYSLDFCYKNKNIEYDGERWHDDPLRDQNRDEYLTSKNFLILRIKHLEYKNDPINTLKKCIEFIGENNE